MFSRSGHHLVNALSARDVSTDAERVVTKLHQVFGGLLRGIGVDLGNDHSSTLGGQSLAVRAPDAVAAARDNRDPAAQSIARTHVTAWYVRCQITTML